MDEMEAFLGKRPLADDAMLIAVECLAPRA